MVKKLFACLSGIMIVLHLPAQITLHEQAGSSSFPLHEATIVFDEQETALIPIVSSLLQQDVLAVSGQQLSIKNKIGEDEYVVLLGTPERSAFIQQLANAKKINLRSLQGIWEAYSIQLVDAPFPGVKKALVITGADKRGVAYGTFTISEKIGVSPWYWWADVPVPAQAQLHIDIKGTVNDHPRVKYRGIFINDEAPALSGWSSEKFGGFNHKFYTKVFELILRNKGNFLWPAMWGSAFYDDDPKNQLVAEEWGIVISTSHHEPLMRAHDEWRRYGKGEWNYSTNAATLRDFWTTGLERAKNEKVITLGMRGDGDEPMSKETATELLERIVADQRIIIEKVTGKPADQSPQVWALYKEVQDYYDKGMRVPDDVTLLICDDNWGNVRRLPKPGSPARKGGYGMYYHFDYVGGPRNYKWLNTNPLPRIWEQMNLTWEHGVRELWVVNVGDIKPMELPISFFLSQAWDPERFTIESVQPYTVQWASQQFGTQYATEIAELLAGYAKINGRRKPELLDQRTYSLHHYNEFENVVNEYNQLLSSARNIEKQLAPQYKDAFFQLVLHPVWACANLNELYYQVALNHHYNEQKDLRTNITAAKARELYEQDSLITLAYHQLNNGKWNHMMSQTHIGYTYWQQPPFNSMPKVYTLQEGSFNESADQVQPATGSSEATIPAGSPPNTYFEKDGVVSMNAAEATRIRNGKKIRWQVLPDLGRTADAITSMPVTHAPQTIGKKTPVLEYDFYTASTGEASLTVYFSPTLNIYHSEKGLQYGIQIDDEAPQIISINIGEAGAGVWNQWMTENIIKTTSRHQIRSAGKHTIRYWLIDNAVVVQKLVLDLGGEKESQLGPPPTKK